MAYSIQIDEPQRAALLQVLKDAGVGTNDNDGDPLVYWQEMLTDLAKDEAESPGVLHGFCL